MKKTIVGIMTVVAMIVAILGTTVNAATLSVNKTEVKKGEKVTVTVTTDDPMVSVQYNIVYDPEYFAPVEGTDGKIAVATTEGTLASKGAAKEGTNEVIVSAFGTAGKVTSVEFEALKDVEKTEFSVKGTEFLKSRDEVATETVPNTVSVKIGEAEATDTPTPTPSEKPDTPTPTSTPTPAPTEAPKTNGKPWPQTGAPVYAYVAGIALVAIVAGVVVAVRKNK